MDKNSLAHTKWNCEYHIVITPKYRRQIIYKDISRDIGSIIRTLCARKGVEIIEAAAMPDHIHLYVAIPPKYAVSDFMGYLKGKSSLMIYEQLIAKEKNFKKIKIFGVLSVYKLLYTEGTKTNARRKKLWQ